MSIGNTTTWQGIDMATEMDHTWAFGRYDARYPQIAERRWSVTEAGDGTVSVAIVRDDEASNGIWTLAEYRASLLDAGVDLAEVEVRCDEMARLMAEAAERASDGEADPTTRRIRVSISICPTDLELSNGDQYDPNLLVAAIRRFVSGLYPAAIVEVQVGHRQGDRWATVDGDADAGEALIGRFFAETDTDDLIA